jgi:RNA methyltransferase, TrmH family
MYAYLSKAELSRFAKLSRRRYREETGLFIAEGLRVVQQLLRRGVIEVQTVIVAEGRESLLDEIFEAGCGWKLDGKQVRVAAPDQLSRLADTEHSQGIIAICRIPEPLEFGELTGFQRGVPPAMHRGVDVILALDRIQDPGNMGSLYRLAAWFGVVALLPGNGTVDLFNPKVVRSTAGALGSVPLLNGDLPALLDELANQGWEVVVMDAHGEPMVFGQTKFSQKTVLVLGNEANGVDPVILERAKKIMSIPGNSDSVESLNAATAASIGLFVLKNQVPQ